MVYDNGRPQLWEMCMNDGDCYRFWAGDPLIAEELAYLLNADHFWFDEARKSEPFDLYLVSDKLSSQRVFDRDWMIASNIQRDYLTAPRDNELSDQIEWHCDNLRGALIQVGETEKADRISRVMYGQED